MAHYQQSLFERTNEVVTRQPLQLSPVMHRLLQLWLIFSRVPCLSFLLQEHPAVTFHSPLHLQIQCSLYTCWSSFPNSTSWVRGFTKAQIAAMALSCNGTPDKVHSGILNPHSCPVPLPSCYAPCYSITDQQAFIPSPTVPSA